MSTPICLTPCYDKVIYSHGFYQHIKREHCLSLGMNHQLIAYKNIEYTFHGTRGLIFISVSPSAMWSRMVCEVLPPAHACDMGGLYSVLNGTLTYIKKTILNQTRWYPWNRVQARLTRLASLTLLVARNAESPCPIPEWRLVSVNFISLVTACIGLLEEESQTAYPMSHIAADATEGITCPSLGIREDLPRCP